MYDVYENLEDYNPTNKRRGLIVLDDSSIVIEGVRTLVFF